MMILAPLMGAIVEGTNSVMVDSTLKATVSVDWATPSLKKTTLYSPEGAFPSYSKTASVAELQLIFLSSTTRVPADPEVRKARQFAGVAESNSVPVKAILCRRSGLADVGVTLVKVGLVNVVSSTVIDEDGAVVVPPYVTVAVVVASEQGGVTTVILSGTLLII